MTVSIITSITEVISGQRLGVHLSLNLGFCTIALQSLVFDYMPRLISILHITKVSHFFVPSTFQASLFLFQIINNLISIFHVFASGSKFAIVTIYFPDFW